MSFSGSFTTPTKKFKQTKRLACETWWNYSPVNTTEFGVENIVKFQIPTTDAIFDMSRAFITLDYMMPVQLIGFTTVDDYINNPTVEYERANFNYLNASGLRTNEFVDGDIVLKQSTGYNTTYGGISGDTDPVQVADFGGFTNAATIFSLAEMYMDGNLLSHDDYCQTQARLWQDNKNQSWLEGQKQTFFTPCSSNNSDLDYETYSTVFNTMILNKNNILPANINSKTGVEAKYYVKKQLKIPLVMLYPQFEVLNGWPSFLIKQILYLQLTVSDVTKYFCSFYSPRLDDRDFNVLDIGTRNGQVNQNPYLNYIFGILSNGRNPQFVFNNGGVFKTPPTTAVKDLVFEFDIDNLQLQNVTLYLPAHTPEFKERQEYQALVNKGLTYGFKSFNILSNTFDLTVDNATGSNTQAQSYNSSVNNLEAVNMLTMRDGTEVVYDKPSVSALQCNLGNSWMQAASGTHVENLYTMDSDLYEDLLKGWGQLDKAYYNTVSKTMEKSFKFNGGALFGLDHTDTAVPLTPWGILLSPNVITGENLTTDYFRANYGSYTTYFDVSPGDEMGVSSGQYSKLINLRFNTTRPSIPSNIILSNGVDSRCNYPNAKIYMCQLTFSTLVITASSVFINNPFAAEVDMRAIIKESQNLNMQANGYRNHGFTSTHGFTATHGWTDLVTGVVPAVVKGIRQLDAHCKRRRLAKFQKRALKALGADGYKQYQKEINHWGQYIKPISKKKLKTWTKEWKQRNQSGTTSGTEHGYPRGPDGRILPGRYGPKICKYIPGTYIKKFRVLSKPRITAGWRGGVNERPIRLQPFGRQGAVPALAGSMTNKHGLMPPYHGILNNLYHTLKPIIKDHIPDKVTDIVKPLKPYADPILNQLKPKIKPKIEQFDDNITHKVDDIVKKPRGKGRGFFHWLGRVFGKKKHGLGGKYMEKSMFNRYYKSANPYRIAVYNRRKARRAGLIGKSSSTGLAKYFGGVTPPHLKKVSEFYREYYGNKHGKNVLKLQKALARGGAQRMYEGMY